MQGFLHASAAGHPGAVTAYSIMLRSGPAFAHSSSLQGAGMGVGLTTRAGCVDNTAGCESGWNGDEQALVADVQGSYTATPPSHVLHASVVSVGVSAKSVGEGGRALCTKRVDLPHTRHLPRIHRWAPERTQAPQSGCGWRMLVACARRFSRASPLSRARLSVVRLLVLLVPYVSPHDVHTCTHPKAACLLVTHSCNCIWIREHTQYLM